jgi:flavin-binding protein dodecin
MAESVYKVIELIGTSKDSWEKAARVVGDSHRRVKLRLR